MMRPNDVKELISMWMIDVDHFNVNMFILNDRRERTYNNSSSQSIMFVTSNVVKIKSNVWIDLNIENIINQIQYNL